ncbi:MAG: T9SS type A sorting domain-containing protein [Bacteroidetes bacterium]|nr:T9SS type A sorting domain-containing protein [Bacteroidota bacterium]
MRFFHVLLICSSFNLFAQFNFEPSNDVSFIVGGQTLAMPTFGGLNYAQFADMDLDFDGDLDLVIFDRSNNNIRALRNELIGGQRQYVPIEKSYFLFPEDVFYRLQLYDYDNDGKKDLFTYGIGGIKVYRNVGNSTIGLKWEVAKNLLYSKFQNNSSNLYVSLSDIPALIDVDHDGDMDVLTFNINGVHLEYHQNQSIEKYGHADSLVFEIKNECWGKFSEDANNSSILLNDPNSPCSGGGGVSNPQFKSIDPKGGMHSGSTVLALDLNNDQVIDLILGDLSSNKLTKLINGGTAPNTNSAMVSVEYNFPQNTLSLDLEAFPAAFYLDVDFDGLKDLVVGTNAKNVSENVNSVWFYKNTGTNSAPIFAFQQKNFLQKEMIDVGTASVPVFFDQNNDGKEDLLIANFYRYIPNSPFKQSNISVYRNTSTTGNQSFTFLDDNFLNLTNENLGLRMLPSFGDLNGDGKKDLLLSLENGTFRLYLNTSTTGNATFSAPSGNLRNAQNTEINESSYPYGQLFDLDNDGLLDIIVGKKNGLLVFYKNIGTTTSPVFDKKNDHLGNIDVSGVFPDGYAMPHFLRVNDTTHLFLGSVFGKLRYYRGIDSKLDPDSSFSLYSDHFLNLDIQGNSSFFVNDIDADGFLDLWAGQDLGGLMHLEVDPNSTSNLREEKFIPIEIYPNPNQGSFQIKGQNLQENNIEIYSLLGQKIDFETLKTVDGYKVNFRQNTKGVFIVSVQNNNNPTKQIFKIVVN